MTIGDLYAQAHHASRLKRAVPLGWVLTEKLGVDLLPKGRRFVGRCPWHDDETPSLDLFGDDLDRWGCFPCGLQGDVFDLVIKAGLAQNFTEACELLHRWATEENPVWDGGEECRRPLPEMDPVRLRQLYEAAIDDWLVDAYVGSRQFPFPDGWLQERWGVRGSQDRILIPHFDPDGQLTGMKWRTTATKPIAIPGTTYRHLYGVWLDKNPRKPVLLVEGESDAWVADWRWGQDYAVLALPTGAPTFRHEMLQPLFGREVVLAFDGDKAGRKALRNWVERLKSVAEKTYIVPLQDGCDLASVGFDFELNPRPIPVAPPELVEQGDNYYFKTTGQKITQLSNWVFVPETELHDDTGPIAWQGVLQPWNRQVVLTADDLATKNSLTRWANRHGGTWHGSDRDVQNLLGMLHAAGPFLAQGRIARVIGWHQNTFVLPDRVIGPGRYWYVPNADLSIERYIDIPDAEGDPHAIFTLLELHEPQVTHPILAWFAVTPLRALLDTFPFLAITGSSGTGKTTLTQQFCRMFGSKLHLNLTSTTRYGLSAHAEGISGIVLHIDEYRPGVRADTKEALDQILRDAYNGASMARGGMSAEHWSVVRRTPLLAPILISGEDVPGEVSLLQRSIHIPLPLTGRNTAALQKVRQMRPFMNEYLTWLVTHYNNEQLPAIENYMKGDPTLHERIRYNLGVLDLGWELLQRWIGSPLPEMDLSLVETEARNAMKIDPVREAVIWAVGEWYAGLAQLEGNNVVLKLDNFIHEAKRRFPLPGDRGAIERWLIQHLDARVEWRGNTRVHVFARDKLLHDE